MVTRLLPRKNDKAWLSLPLHSHNYNLMNAHNKTDQTKLLKGNLLLQEPNHNNKTADHLSRGISRGSQVSSSKTATGLMQWLPIPPKLKAYTSYYEQLRRAHNSKPANRAQSTNYFDPLRTLLFDQLLEMSDEELVDLAQAARSDIDREMENPGTPPRTGLAQFSSTQRSTVVTARVDDLEQILGLAQTQWAKCNSPHHPTDICPHSPPLSSRKCS